MATSVVMSVGGDSNALRWDLLEAQPPNGERLTVRAAITGRQQGVLIALDASRRRHLLLEIPANEAGDIAERVSRGIAVETVVFRTDVDGEKRYVEITCLDEEGHAALNTIALELVDALEAGASIERIRLVQNVLAKWRRFWSGVSRGILSKEQQLGLFGELWFLNQWLTPNIGVSRAVQMWRGPVGARNDFEHPGLAIEVKTTGRIDCSHIIHGIEQLLEPLVGDLMLFSLVVRDEGGGAESLPSLIAQSRELIGDDYDLQSRFDSMLYAAGYDDRQLAEYSKLALRVRSEGLYRVCDGFPRLVPSSLIGGLPSGVEAIEYRLRLDAAAAWLLASNPHAAASYFKISQT